jgi:hypothetical protein
MRRLVVALAAAALAIVPAGAARGAGDATAVISPLGMYVAHSPNPVLGGDGRMHLAYEIKIANQTDLVVTVQSVQATAGGKPIGRLYDAAELAKTMRIDGDAFGDAVEAGQGATLFMDVAYPVKRKPPSRLRHRVALSFHPASDPTATQTQSYTGVKVPVGTEPALEVAPPLRGELWLVANGCCEVPNAHRGATLSINGTIDTPERFAIDFVQLTSAYALTDGGPYDQLSSWPYFGDRIHAATDGKVVRIQDGLPEQVPGALPPDATVQTAGGNHIVVRVDAEHYAFYAHMQPGSLRVKVGDRVRTGQVLGLLGNTGNTDGPHLHFHVMDGPSPLQSNGLPFTFTSWRGQGMVTDETPLFSGQSAPVDPSALAGKRRAAMPLNDQLVKFK